MMRKNHAIGLLAIGLLGTPALATAHGQAGIAAGLMPGLAHPVLGLDHLLAMLGVGLWAAQGGGRALWAYPAVFVGGMLAGGMLGMTGFALPWVEPLILTSLLLIGALVAGAARPPLAVGMATVAALSLFHGHAHGSEIPVAASGFAYAAGFLTATTLLHLGVIGAAGPLQRVHTGMVRLAGTAIALTGLILAAG